MQWFLAKLVFRIISGSGDHTPQFDEQLRLIHAIDELDGFERARRLGHEEQDSFENEASRTVEWRFVDVAEILPFRGFVHGAELYSCIHEQDNGVRYTEFVRQKAEHVRDKLMHKYLQPILATD